MKIEKVDVLNLIPDPSNARKHSQKNIDAIKGSLARFGQQTERFFERITLSPEGCWNFKDIQPHTGYGKFHSNGITWRAHRWVMWALGKIVFKDQICVLHLCDNRRCVNPNHLYLGDRKKNAQDIKDRGRIHLLSDPKKGSKNPQAKLNEKIVLEIREKLKNGVSGKDLSKQYFISKTTISEIKHKKVWGHL